MSNLLFDYNIKKITQILYEDYNLENSLKKYGYDKKIHKNTIRDISILLISNNDFISNNDITYLVESSEELVSELNEITKHIQENIFLNKEVFHHLLYSYKYSRVKNFFYDNYQNFLIPLDYEYISNSKKQKIFFESLMKEFDKFSSVISSIENLYDVDKVEGDLLYYLLSLFGYSKIEDDFLNIHTLRELTKNILEIYRIKGTKYSFELFFNFLGYNIEIDEFWFDKRFHSIYNTTSQNPFTGSNDESNINFYLTPIKPTENHSDLKSRYSLNENELTDIKNIEWFSRNLSDGYSIEQILDEEESDLPEDRKFCFFKTNVINYRVRRIEESDSDVGLSNELYEAVVSYADFLVPVFIRKVISYDTGIFDEKIRKFVKEKIIISGVIDNKLHDLQSKDKTRIDDLYKLKDLVRFLGYEPEHISFAQGFSNNLRFNPSMSFSLRFNNEEKNIVKEKYILNEFFSLDIEEKEILQFDYIISEDGLNKTSEDNSFKVMEY